jgi:acyl carrier protein
MDINKTIKEFMISHFLKGDATKTISDDSSFLEGGIIDSVGVLELVAFIEEKYGFRVEDEELVPENLDSVEKLVAYIQSKLAAVRS